MNEGDPWGTDPPTQAPPSPPEPKQPAVKPARGPSPAETGDMVVLRDEPQPAAPPAEPPPLVAEDTSITIDLTDTALPSGMSRYRDLGRGRSFVAYGATIYVAALFTAAAAVTLVETDIVRLLMLASSALAAVAALVLLIRGVGTVGFGMGIRRAARFFLLLALLVPALGVYVAVSLYNRAGAVLRDA